MFPRLLNMRLHQGSKGHVWLVEQTIQGFCPFPVVHLSRQRTQRVLRQVAGCLDGASRSAAIVQLDVPKGVLGPTLGVSYFLRLHP
nr:hypothetical protein [Ktedonobacter sp. SOSP1-52]